MGSDFFRNILGMPKNPEQAMAQSVLPAFEQAAPEVARTLAKNNPQAFFGAYHQLAGMAGIGSMQPQAQQQAQQPPSVQPVGEGTGQAAFAQRPLTNTTMQPEQVQQPTPVNQDQEMMDRFQRVQGQSIQYPGPKKPGFADRFAYYGAGIESPEMKESLAYAQARGTAEGTLPAEVKKEYLKGQLPPSQDTIFKETVKMSQEGMLKPNDLFTKLEQASQPFITQRDAFSRVQASAEDPSAAGDLAMIFNYMKVLDPGSTVREGEFANAQNAAGIPQRIMAQYNSIINGKRLSNNQRKDFLKRSQMLFKAAEQDQKKTTEQFSTLAKRNRINPNRLFRDVGLAQAEKKDGSQMKIGRFQVKVS